MLEALATLAKLVLYAGSLAGAGAALAWASLGQRLDTAAAVAPAIVIAGASFTLVASIGTVAILIERLGGDFGGPALAAIFEGPSGLAAGLQIAGAVLLLAFARSAGAAWILRMLGALLVVASFAVNGHAAAANFISGCVAFAHVSAAAWWFGALFLLWFACRRLSPHGLEGLVRAFSRIAVGIVAGLVVAGAVLILTLVDFSRAPWLSPYGQLLALKVALAGLVLALALYNKLWLTPRLSDEDGNAIRLLRRSVTAEMAVFVAVLSATAVLTIYTSPHA